MENFKGKYVVTYDEKSYYKNMNKKTRNFDRNIPSVICHFLESQ